MSERNKDIVRRWIEECINHGNLAIVDELFAPDVVAHEPMGDIHGLEGPRQAVSLLRSAFPDLRIAVDDLIAEGDKLAVRWTGTGTHLGAFLGTPPTGNLITLKAIYVYRIAGGRIAEVWVSRDDLGLMKQLGPS